MSRLKKFTHSLLSGYLQIGVNVFYTLTSIPLALHFLSPKQFALWQVAVSVAGYLLLVDFGLTDSMSRILMDHKDDPRGGVYGSVIKISIAVCCIQGLLITACGIIISFWMPQIVNLRAQFSSPEEISGAARALFFLTSGQCALQGLFFPSRVLWNLAAAHQRFDLYNYTQTGSLILNFVALWISFHNGLGIYSVLVAGATSSVFGFCCGLTIALRCNFLPPRGCWGRFDFARFKEIFVYGGNIFLMVIGNQLIYASQVLIVSHALGLTAAAVWTVAIKPFAFAQQLVGRIFDFSFGAFSEMFVRNERQRFVRRFGDLVIFSAVAAVFIFCCVALCNVSFLQVWLFKKPEMLQAIRLNWNPADNLLLAFWFIIVTVTRCNIGLSMVTKQVGRMRYVYFIEGVTFFVTAIFVAPVFGIPGIIVAAIIADLLWSGIYGTWRTGRYLGIPVGKIIKNWLARPVIYFAVFGFILIASHFLTKNLTPPIVCLTVNVAISGVMGLTLLWLLALNPEARNELKTILARGRKKLSNYFGFQS